MVKIISLIALLIRSVQADWGCLKLDNYTLDSVIAWPDYTFLVKLDDSYGFGEKVDIYKKLCKASHGVKNFFIAYVPIQEYNDRDNQDVKDSFGITKEDFPHYYLYQGSNRSRHNFIKYDGAVNLKQMSRWLRDHHIRLPSPDTIDELDMLAEEFMKAPDAAKFAHAKEVAKHYESDGKTALYLKTMERVLEKGPEYALNEFNRVAKILKGGMAAAQRKAEMSDKIKVLKVFANPPTCEAYDCPDGYKTLRNAGEVAGEDAESCCEEKCEDLDHTDGGEEISDEQGHHCDYYDTDRTAKECGDWDDDDFRANQVCCSCGGGSRLGYKDSREDREHHNREEL